jgi:hypothetical protein
MMEVTGVHVYLDCIVRFPNMLPFLYPREARTYMTLQELDVIQRIGLAEVQVLGLTVICGFSFQAEAGDGHGTEKVAEKGRKVKRKPTAAHSASR